MEIGTKLLCTNDVFNIFNQPLFIKDQVYEILHVYGSDSIVLNHILYANEYADFDMNFIKENFIEYYE